MFHISVSRDKEIDSFTENYALKENDMSSCIPSCVAPFTMDPFLFFYHARTSSISKMAVQNILLAPVVLDP